MTAPGRPFTDVDDAQLRRLWRDTRITIAIIGQRMGRSKDSVAKRAYRLNLPSRPQGGNCENFVRKPPGERLPAEAPSPNRDDEYIAKLNAAGGFPTSVVINGKLFWVTTRVAA